MVRRLVVVGLVIGVVAVGVVVGPRLFQRIDYQFLPPPLCQPPATDLPVTVSWTRGAALPNPRGAAAYAVLDGSIYQAGGFIQGWQPTTTFDRYDMAEDQWVTLAPLPKALHRAGLTALGGKLYLTGGFDGPFFSEPRSTEAWVYDPPTDTWSPIAALPSPRAAHAAVALDDRLLLLAGDGPNARQLWEYDPLTNSWDTDKRTLLPEPARDNPGVALYDGQVFLFGGRWRETGNYGMVDVYDVAADTWERRGDMPAPRSTAIALVVGDVIHLMGGQEIERACTNGQHEVYDPLTDQWTSLAFLPSARHSFGAAFWGEKLVLVGGAAGAGPRMQYQFSDRVDIGNLPSSDGG